MEIESLKERGWLVIRLQGRMDAAGVPDFDRECGDWLDRGEHNMVLDCAKLEYISSIGLRSILVLGKRLKGVNGTLRICGLNKAVGGIFEISGFTGIFPIFDSLESALA